LHQQYMIARDNLWQHWEFPDLQAGSLLRTARKSA